MKNSIYILFLLFAVSLNSQTFQQKDFSIGFPHEQPNQAVDILFGNSFINGWIEVDIAGTFSHQNSVGVIKKLFQIGANPSNSVWYPPTSRIVEAAGPILDNIYIGDIVWDPTINQYKLTIYHTSPNANPYNIRLTQHSYDQTVLGSTTLGTIYTNPLNGNNRHSVYYNDNVGIGTTNPVSKLHIASNKQEESSYGDLYIGDSATSVRLGTTSDYSWIQSHGSKPLYINRLGNNIVLNNQGGNVGIGTINPQNKLDVNGTVHAKEVKVDMAGWADFVFEKEYQLPTLDEVEQHIYEKGHLPNIPNTKEVTENGLSLGESQKLLLQKIEELTLYSIEQNKLNKEQSELLRQQQQEIQDLRNEIKVIKK
ncbi:hypothetical protein M2T78_02715 [Elizabethkingia ursingii]|uniref:hypothetical protein n=1 Tax=Elizabethkingia ursingii TaxID=1756150 RepID=UPI00201234E5|nr:hypothetical protein [Elizabethkingia ursingii]MCL1663147.1 hypothetical protein [Elizabethkingia ursingii]